MLYQNNVRVIGAVALSILSGCGSVASVSPAPPATIAAKTSTALAYVVDSSGDVGVYSYPGFSKRQTLSGFNEPQGECVDPSGNVWIADTQNSRLVEYAHGGSQPIATLNDSAGIPVSCAVSSSSGTLAVGNILSKSYGPGNMVLYAHAAGTGTVVPGSQEVYFLGYDSHDNLFGGGKNSASQFELFELAKKAKAIQTVDLKGAVIGFPGAVQYVNNVLNLSDQEAAVTYEARVKKGVATITGSTPLTGSSDCAAVFIYKNRLLCPDAGSQNLKIYAYPKGGTPVRMVSGISGGIVISAPSK